MTIALVEEEELAPAREWASRVGVELTWDSDRLEIRAVLTQRTTGERFYLRGQLEGYRAVPPAWTFCDAEWGSPGEKRNFPASASLPSGIGSSIFHNHPVICAPFNRLAYKDHGGPHSNWGGPEQWLNVAGTVNATTLADMLAVVARDLAYSKGRM
jgi:hypothetical protein